MPGKNYIDLQRGYILLLVPVVLIGILMLGMQMMRRSQVAMNVAGAEMDYLQTRMCNEGILAVEVNRAAAKLESGATLTSESRDIDCSPGEGHPPVKCKVEIEPKGSENSQGCYDINYFETAIGLKSTCGDGSAQKSVLDENVRLGEVPLFQFAVFYDGNMHIHPGPRMDIQGKVHSNDAILLNGIHTMTFSNWITSVNNMSIEQRQNTAAWFAHSHTTAPDSGNPVTGTMGITIELKTAVAGWEDFKENHRVAYGEEENGCGPVQKLTVPVRGPEGNRELIEWRREEDDDGVRLQKPAWRAGFIYREGGWLNGNEEPVNPVPNPRATPTAPVGWTMVDAIRVTINDFSEDRLFFPIPIDVARLQLRSPLDSIIYLHDDYMAFDAVQGNKQAGGFLLYNGATLTRPLTIVSNNRIFLLGDYNTTPGYNIVGGGVGVYPAAIMADHLTHLSNFYNPTNHDELGEGRGPSVNLIQPGAPLQLNACLTVGGRPGVNGFPIGVHLLAANMEHLRFTNHGITGSLTWLFPSKYVTAPINVQSYYAPDRKYAFDPMYNNSANMPPGTPRLITPTLVDWELVR